MTNEIVLVNNTIVEMNRHKINIISVMRWPNNEQCTRIVDNHKVYHSGNENNKHIYVVGHWPTDNKRWKYPPCSPWIKLDGSKPVNFQIFCFHRNIMCKLIYYSTTTNFFRLLVQHNGIQIKKKKSKRDE